MTDTVARALAMKAKILASFSTVEADHVFLNTTTRDDYFVANPSEKVTGVLISVADGFQQWIGGTWVDKALVVQGPKGDTGATGLKGDTGIQGTQGVQGLQGIQGEKGDTGLQGTTGLKGDTGDQGLQGIQGIQGIQGTAGSNGTNGDSAYEEAVTQGYVGTEVEWLATLIGPTGDQGIQGLQGDQGIQGIQGLQGDQGIQGIQGDAGADGADGLSGVIADQNGGGNITLWSGTQAQYDAIGTKDAKRLYIIPL